MELLDQLRGMIDSFENKNVDESIVGNVVEKVKSKKHWGVLFNAHRLGGGSVAIDGVVAGGDKDGIGGMNVQKALDDLAKIKLIKITDSGKAGSQRYQAYKLTLWGDKAVREKRANK